MRSCTGYIAESLEPRLLLSVDSQSTPSAFAGMPAVFVPNQGQWDQAIRYAAHGTGADILFTDTGPTFRIVDQPDTPRDPLERGVEQEEALAVPRPVTATEWSLSFVDAARVAPIGLDQQQTVFNYYLGDQSTWRAGVTSFGGVVYRDLWTGIDAHVMARDGGMKYEFHLDPGADPRSIALRYNGVEGLSLNKSGGLSIRTSGGTITDDAPVAWQTRRDGTRVHVAAKFVLLDASTYTIAPTGAYDRSLPLVLDPQLVFGSFLGGSGADNGISIASDGAGGAWITGETNSINFPTPGGFDTANDGSDAFVARVSAPGILAFASFLGGSDADHGSTIVPDGAGGAWVTGSTSSANFPTLGGFDTTYNGGGDDVFVARVAGGGTLDFGSYLGGSSGEEADGITSDGVGGAWMTGYTQSSDFPTSGGFDATYNGGSYDAFVVRVTDEGLLAVSSFLGGDRTESGNGITSADAGGAWVTGNTSSANFPTPNGFDTTYDGGDADAFVARVTFEGTLAFASYLGGSGYEVGRDLAPDSAGGAWLTGATNGSFPTPGGFDTTYNGGAFDAFVARITASGTFIFASYLGGNGHDSGLGIAADGVGGAWLTGDTNSDFPTPGGFDTTYNGNGDGFVARVTSSGTLSFGSYLGGNGFDTAQGIVSDGVNGAWVTGYTSAANFPTPGGFDTTYNGSGDAFIIRIADVTPPTVTTSQFAFESAPQSIRITFSENVFASLSLQDLTLENLTTGQTIPSGNLALSYDTTSNIATIAFPGYPYGVLPDGTYRATLLAAGVTDAAGNPLPSNHVLDFFFMQGDADHNGVIDFDDYVYIDQGFNNGWTGFSNGDFDYNGVIDFDDYVLIDLAFNSQ